MKIHRLIIFAFSGAILLGLVAGVFISADHPETVFARPDQNRDRIPENAGAASISKGSILLLLAVGVIGVLGVNRKKKHSRSDWNGHAADRASQPPQASGDRRTDQT